MTLPPAFFLSASCCLCLSFWVWESGNLQGSVMCDSARWSVSFHHLTRLCVCVWYCGGSTRVHHLPAVCVSALISLNEQPLTSFIHTGKNIRTHRTQPPQAPEHHLFVFHICGSPSFLRFIRAISLLRRAVESSAVYLLALVFLPLPFFSCNSHLRW